MKKALPFFLLLLPTGIFAQNSYYFHTIHSSSLAASYGRTYKVHYAYQLSRLRQLKLSGLYVFDEYTQADGNRIKSDLYNVHVQFQYNLIHWNKVFLSANAGVGGYFLRAGDLIGIEHKERKINFGGGFQGEYYLKRNSLAILVDYDILYMPFSDLYEFLHVPTVGVGVFF
jgi:hypothetical protein